MDRFLIRKIEARVKEEVAVEDDDDEMDCMEIKEQKQRKKEEDMDVDMIKEEERDEGVYRVKKEEEEGEEGRKPVVKSEGLLEGKTHIHTHKGENDLEEQKEEKVPLSLQQRAVLRAVMEGRNVFFTGRAGTGKSTLLREIIKRGPQSSLYITATTGIGIGEDPYHIMLSKARNGKGSKENWKYVRVLIIDEISMLSAELFDKIERIARDIKQSDRPFGGIQLIATGDFMQLPPVKKGGDTPQNYFCFEALSWQHCFPPESIFELETIFRQAEKSLVEALGEVRYGKASQKTINLFSRLQRELKPPEGIDPTKLLSKNVDVNMINKSFLDKLPGEPVAFKADDWGSEPHVGQLRKNCIAEEQLLLKVDAQVMLLKNLSLATGLVNGSKGRVTGFQEVRDGESGVVLEIFPVVKFENGLERTVRPESWEIMISGRGDKMVSVASRTQIPLKLAWAMTIHKSQGMSLKWVEVKLRDVFEDGQAYVALSRAVAITGLRILDFDPKKFRVSPRVVEYYRDHIKGRFREENGDERDWNIHELWSGNDRAESVLPINDNSEKQKRRRRESEKDEKIKLGEWKKRLT